MVRLPATLHIAVYASLGFPLAEFILLLVYAKVFGRATTTAISITKTRGILSLEYSTSTNPSYYKAPYF